MGRQHPYHEYLWPRPAPPTPPTRQGMGWCMGWCCLVGVVCVEGDVWGVSARWGNGVGVGIRDVSVWVGGCAWCLWWIIPSGPTRSIKTFFTWCVSFGLSATGTAGSRGGT